MILSVNKILILLCAFCAFTFADTAGDVQNAELQKVKLQAEIKKLDRSIKETDSLLTDDVHRYSVLENRYKDDLSRRRSELDSLNEKIKRIASEIQSERNKQSAFGTRVANEKGHRQALRKVIGEAASALETKVARSLPWERETRLDRIRGLVRDVKGADATEEELFSRFLSIVSEEVRFGDEIRLVESPVVRNNGETVNARVLRLGNQWMVYSDENNRMFGALVRKDFADSVHYEWNENLTLEERAAIRLALDVKEAKKPPQVVSLPLSIGVFGKENAK